jgi:putative heme degradation protein
MAAAVSAIIVTAAHAEDWSSDEIYFGLLLTTDTMKRDALQCAAFFGLNNRPADEAKAYQVADAFGKAAFKLSERAVSEVEQSKSMLQELKAAKEFVASSATDLAPHCEELAANPKKVWAEYFYKPGK